MDNNKNILDVPTIEIYTNLMNYYVQLTNLISSSHKDLYAIKTTFFKYVSFLNSLSGSLEEIQLINYFSHVIPDFQKLSQDVEMILEILFAESVIHGESSLKSYMNERYQKIIESEIFLIKKYIGTKTNLRILFCGGGPLPISSILMTLNKSIQVTLLDNNSLACHLAKSIVHSNTLFHNITLLEPQSVEDFTSFKEYDAIILAAMIGSTKSEKIKIYKKMAEKLPPNTYIFTRAANPIGVSCFQYDSFPFEELSGVYKKVIFQPIAHDVTVYNVVLQRK